jgi:hypothetical protein
LLTGQVFLTQYLPPDTQAHIHQQGTVLDSHRDIQNPTFRFPHLSNASRKPVPVLMSYVLSWKHTHQLFKQNLVLLMCLPFTSGIKTWYIQLSSSSSDRRENKKKYFCYNRQNTEFNISGFF